MAQDACKISSATAERPRQGGQMRRDAVLVTSPAGGEATPSEPVGEDHGHGREERCTAGGVAASTAQAAQTPTQKEAAKQQAERAAAQARQNQQNHGREL